MSNEGVITFGTFTGNPGGGILPLVDGLGGEAWTEGIAAGMDLTLDAGEAFPLLLTGSAVGASDEGVRAVPFGLAGSSGWRVWLELAEDPNLVAVPADAAVEPLAS